MTIDREAIERKAGKLHLDRRDLAVDLVALIVKAGEMRDAGDAVSVLFDADNFLSEVIEQARHEEEADSE